jgi:hypothetical protein
MKKALFCVLSALITTSLIYGQKINEKEVPNVVKAEISKKYPNIPKVTWEKEKGNFEANWGGKSGEDHSIVYSPEGKLLETSEAIPVSALPVNITSYVREHYKSEKIKDADKVTNAKGKITYEVEVNKKDLIFDEKGNFLKTEEE